jgi:transposase
MLYVGIDVAKNKHDCCIIDSDGVIHVNSMTISNSKEGFELLCRAISDCLTATGFDNVRIGLESTGHYSNNISHYLYSKGFQLTTLNPLATNLFRKAQTLRKTKTDKGDAKVIAYMLITDDTKSYSPLSCQIGELKSLTRHRYRLIGYRSKLKISITRLVDIIFPELPSAVWSINQKSSYALLLEYPSTEMVSNSHLTKLINLLVKASKGKYSRDKAITLKNLASNSIGTCNRALSFELKQTIRLIQSVQAEIDELDKQIKLVVNELD